MRSLHVAVAILGVLASAVTGCQVATGPAHPTGLEITATAPGRQLVGGHSVLIGIGIKNVSEHPVQIPGGPIIAFLDVRNGRGQPVAFGRFEIVELKAYAPRTLEPGEAVIGQAPWAGEGTHGGSLTGQYLIRAAVPIVGARSDDSYAYSDPVAVELVSP